MIIVVGVNSATGAEIEGSSLHQLRSQAHALDLRTTFLLRLPQVIGDLHVEPRFGGAAKRGGKPDSHLGAHRTAIHDAGERDAGDAQALGKLSQRSPSAFNASCTFGRSCTRAMKRCTFG
jgi:hypothetical protein